MTFVLTTSVLASCSSNPKGTEKTPTTAASSGTAASARTKASEGKAEDTGYIEVFNGKMPLPKSLDNFVVLKNTLIENFTSLGIKPKAVTLASKPTAETSRYSRKYYMDGPARVFANGALDGVEVMSTKLANDLERILALKPDFIVAGEREAQYLDKLQAIAPTYIIPSKFEGTKREDVWIKQYQLIAKLVGKEKEAEANIKAYDELAAKFRKEVSKEVEGKTALVLQLNPKGFKVRMPDQQPQVYRDLGFGVPAGLSKDMESTSVSAENGAFPIEMIAPFNPDYIFIDIQSEKDYQALRNTPIWKNLKAVKNGKLMEISHFIWNQSRGPISNTIHLTDAANFVLHGTQVTSDLFTK